MIGPLRAEWIKLTTTVSSWVLVILAIAIPLLIVTLTGAFADAGMDGQDLGELVTGVGLLSATLLAALSTISVTSEFATNTIRPTFAALPDRWRPLLGKMTVQTSVTAVGAGVVSALWIVGSGLVDGDQSLGESGVLASLGGLVVFAIELTLLGLAVGMLLRASALSLIILLLWPLLEGIVGGLLTVAGWETALDWMPYQAGSNLIDVRQYGDDLGRVGGGLYFGAWVAMLLALGLWRTHRRDA